MVTSASKRNSRTRTSARRSKPSSKPSLNKSPSRKSLDPKHKKELIRFAAGRVKHKQWALIARQTVAIALGDGKYVENLRCRVPAFFTSPVADTPETSQLQPGMSTWHVVHDISRQVRLSNEGTVSYSHTSDLLCHWAAKPATSSSMPFTKTAVIFSKRSPLALARRLYLESAPSQKLSPHPLHNSTVGVLSSASPRRAGGAFLNGSSEPDALLARSTSLVASLGTPQARSFYTELQKYTKKHGAGFYPHCMVYSPGVVGFRRDDEDRYDVRDDDFDPELDAIPADPTTAELENPPAVNSQNRRAMGEYVAPYLMNIISVAAVNASSVHSAPSPSPPPSTELDSYSLTGPENVEAAIRRTMKERVGRALRLFELHGNRTLVVGAFGCNQGLAVETIARIYAELLFCSDGNEGDGRFRGVFDKVVFSLSSKLRTPFQEAFEMRIYEDELTSAMDDVGL
ncbi:hypothetical protein EW146_g6968 [Bondarzewia mesenterica]|uniref:Microbial-type PARG catalytic domain-containing protein n=1 Tax=Bondarzewia mesenterica TaxID=1095465 RepID=A0A4S4LST2_9AGAM|nr:hypothetical protein EW146_g6968 [Bondarzewia mesenterica]